MTSPATIHIPPRVRLLIAGVLLITVAFGGVTSLLPSRLIQPIASLVLGLSSLLAVGLLLLRARAPGPEQRGWRLMALSLLGGLMANGVLFFTPQPLTFISPAELLFFGLQVLISGIQAWAILSWPFRGGSDAQPRIQNLLGSLIFAGSLFLLLWTTSLWNEWDQGRWPLYFRMMGITIRIASLGGVLIYFLAEDPRRVRGPLGWMFVSTAFAGTFLLFLRPLLYDANGFLQPSPLFGVLPAIPLMFGTAAWLGLPVEFPEDQPRLRYDLVDLVLYMPFAAVGVLLLLTALLHHNYLLHQLLGFMAITAVLLVRQFLLLREVRRANEQLEERVLIRTHSLEELQGIMLRTERMNSVGALGAGLAHDLNNALGVITSSTELCKMDLEEGQAPAAADLDRIMVAARQSSVLTSRLMAFARQEEEVLGPIDLAEEVGNMEHVLRMMLPRNIALSMEVGDSPVRLKGSRTRFEQILVNLVGNARDAMPEGGCIRLRLWLEPPSVHLEVIDDGEGMTPETQARMFKPFFTTKPPGKGTGLGLASVKLLVEESGGRIQVDSTLGQGTRFKLSFPLLA